MNIFKYNSLLDYTHICGSYRPHAHLHPSGCGNNGSVGPWGKGPHCGSWAATVWSYPGPAINILLEAESWHCHSTGKCPLGVGDISIWRYRLGFVVRCIIWRLHCVSDWFFVGFEVIRAVILFWFISFPSQPFCCVVNSSCSRLLLFFMFVRVCSICTI